MIVVKIPIYRNGERIHCDFAVNISGMLLDLKSINIVADNYKQYQWEYNNDEVESHVINELQKRFKGVRPHMMHHLEFTEFRDSAIHFCYVVDRNMSNYVNEYIQWVNGG